MIRVVLILALGSLAAPVAAEGWATDAELKKRTTTAVSTKPAPRYTLNLDLPATERWNEIGALYKDDAYRITTYLKDNLPPWAFDPAVKIGAAIEPYFKLYGDEMIGVAGALGLDVGEIVALNLAYQLERIGVTCSNWNNTGPTEGDDAIPRGLSCDPDGTWAAKRAAVLATGPEGRCTSIVTQDSGGAVTHGRNLDWNIPEELKEFVIDLDVFQNGTLLFTGTGAVGFVGMLNGMRQREGGGRWTVSQDARNHGGRIPFNLLEALKTGALTPEQALRHALESEGGGFEAAVAALSEVQIVDDVYFIMSGEGPEDAAVVTRDRNQARDVWRLFVDAATTPHAPTPLPPSTNWWLTETNYDHWKNVPAADNRRDPANENMATLGSKEATDLDAIFGVMSTWPTFNPHTTFTSMMRPASGEYNSTIWYGNSP